jgi:protein-tyrosine phosphatase
MDSANVPLRIWFIDTGEKGQIATTLAIGKKQDDPMFSDSPWCRNLKDDLTQIKLLDKYISSAGKTVDLRGDSWNRNPITTIISVLTIKELQQLEIEGLKEGIPEDEGFEWIGVESWPDATVPEPKFLHDWGEIKDRILQTIKEGDNVLIHCKGGLSRTGALSAIILNGLGLPIDKAISKFREVRGKDRSDDDLLIQEHQEKWLERNFS